MRVEVFDRRGGQGVGFGVEPLMHGLRPDQRRDRIGPHDFGGARKRDPGFGEAARGILRREQAMEPARRDFPAPPAPCASRRGSPGLRLPRARSARHVRTTRWLGLCRSRAAAPGLRISRNASASAEASAAAAYRVDCGRACSRLHGSARPCAPMAAEATRPASANRSAAPGLTLRMAVPINTAPRADSVPVESDFALVIFNGRIFCGEPVPASPEMR